MTRQDYHLVAQALRLTAAISGASTERLEILRRAALAFADLAKADNPRFNSDTFFAATGLFTTPKDSNVR